MHAAGSGGLGVDKSLKGIGKAMMHTDPQVARTTQHLKMFEKGAFRPQPLKNLKFSFGLFSLTSL